MGRWGASWVCGSSPHTRGAQRRERRNDVAQRIIPAYAGSTSATAPSPTPRRDHPRIRGEHASAIATATESVGSSPHTRGAPDGQDRTDPARRIIPAYAGSTGDHILVRTADADHPRIRGEHPALAVVTTLNPGSSPHTRGAPGRTAVERSRRGIIPAYAGSTRPFC